MDDLKIGRVMPFGGYNWRILDIQNNVALIITEDIIELRSYHDTRKDITWAGCELRSYLNGEFYDKFSESDKSRIVTITNKNPDNQWYGTSGGEDTRDNIFLLTIEDVVCKYFGDSSKVLQNRKKNQKYWFQAKDENNSKRVAKRGWWWLRSPGRNNRVAVYIHGSGDVGINGNPILRLDGNIYGGVRPALWLKLGILKYGLDKELSCL